MVRSYLKAALWEYPLCALCSAALAWTLFQGFYLPEALAGSAPSSFNRKPSRYPPNTSAQSTHRMTIFTSIIRDTGITYFLLSVSLFYHERIKK